jgi:hypothetical protein
VSAERQDREVRLEHVPDTTQQTLHDFCFRNIAYGSIIHTEAAELPGLANYGYIHDEPPISQQPSPAHVVMSRVHRVSSS